MTRRLESLALLATLALCAAFLVSFATGIGIPRRHVAETPQSATPADPGGERRGRVEVRNASGRAGLAREATQRLRTAGFDVVFYGNASGSDTTVVIDRVGNAALARAVAAALGIDRVTTAVDSTLLLDASVILGADWVAR
jgi:hypothetical protein